ncbi:glycosyltransferase family 4 protein [Spirosoma fluviale]|uniref:Glycosyltransferase involved in cell wall bisynthesis n=1 Tax=Spirosoma fluviale TaxID=1597977 RepID=A0A286G919_9BACT|nr:glycosyltransferase family 4 protein [Spirosoma fluviale]SOD92020.1 Glycosyltransferase involved in cell wall bisynthesis [Spirosoma fluviale]
MKKVLISAYACIPDRGSEEGNGWFYSSLVSQQGYEVWCLTRDIGKAEIEQKLRQCAYPNLNFEFVTLPGWAEKAGSFGLLGMYFHYLYWQWTALQSALKLTKKHKFDLVHHVSYTSLQLGSYLYKLKLPFIYGPVGGGQEAPATMRHYFKSHWLKEKMRSWVSDLMRHFNPGCYQSVRQADYVLAWNEDTRQMIAAMGRTKGVEKEFGGVGARFIPSKPIHRPTHDSLELVWVGRLMPRKALELSLHGMSKVDPQLPIHLTIVGDGEMGQFVPEYIEKYNLGKRVTWVGKVNYEQVKEYYRQADAFLFTSLRDTGPAQLMEAMGYSLPVVTLKLHGQAELVDDSTGIRVPVTDPETVAQGLAEAITWMYHNEQKRVNMGINAFHFAQQQRWELKVDHIIRRYYTALMGQSASVVMAVSQE